MGKEEKEIMPTTNALMLFVTNRCNLSCSFCHTLQQELDVDIGPVLDIIADMPQEWVFITGGEPLLLDNIVDICDSIRALGKNVCVTTNGTIDRPDIFDHIDRLGVSIDGTQEYHDGYRGEGVYQKAVDFLSSAVGKTHTVLAMTVFRSNKQYINDVIQLGTAIGVDAIQVTRDIGDPSLEFVAEGKNVVKIDSFPHDEYSIDVEGKLLLGKGHIDELITGAFIPTIEVTAVATPSSGEVSLDVTFSGIIDGGVAPYTYLWTLDPEGDDETIGTDIVETYTFTETGVFEVRLSVQDSNFDEGSDSIYVTVTPAGVAVAAQIPRNTQRPPKKIVDRITRELSLNANRSIFTESRYLQDQPIAPKSKKKKRYTGNWGFDIYV